MATLTDYTIYTNDQYKYIMPENYIYLYHLGVFIVLPAYADSVQDSMSVNFASSDLLARSAPIYSFQNSGPRTVQVNFTLHRDMMKQINYQVSNAPVQLGEGEGDDYVDVLVRYLQASVVPAYEATSKMVDPPIVALRLGDDIFIKGVISGSLGVMYHYPILSNGKYALVDLGLSINEVDPYDAVAIANSGSFRGLSTSLQRNLWVTKQTTEIV